MENEYRGFPVLELPDAEEAQDLEAEKMEGETEGTGAEESTETVQEQEGKDSSLMVAVVGVVIAVLIPVLAGFIYRKKKQSK